MSGVDSSEFSIPFDRCAGRTLRPGARCQLVVTFSPSHAGESSARLVFYDDAPNHTQGVGLRRYGQK